MTESLSGKLELKESGTAREVQAMYEEYPYPSPVVGGSLIEDVANSFYSVFGDDRLRGKCILDAGCGTGHRLLALARRYPDAHFVGVDMTAASLEVAAGLVRKHRLTNVELHRGDLVEFRPRNSFDIIVSIGVIHHLENPCGGLASLSAMLGDQGILLIWLYHALGEHQRLLEREMLLTMWNRTDGFAQGLQLLQELGIKLETKRYGSSAAQAKTEVSQRSIDVDAYLHPIVNAYRFEETIEMFRRCACLGWAAINNVNLLDSSKLIDLGEVERGDMRYFCQTIEELFDAPALRQRFRQLSALDKLRVLEIKLAPTGFTIIGGRNNSYTQLKQRLQSNVVSL
jgi:SAM-dependent methyltransferase